MKIILRSYKVTFAISDIRVDHRINGPALVWSDGGKGWVIFNDLHREDGPAFVGPGGDEGWHLFGWHLTKAVALSVVANKSNDTYEVGDVLIKKSDLPKGISDDFPDIHLVKGTGDPDFKVRTRREEELLTSSQINLIYDKV